MTENATPDIRRPSIQKYRSGQRETCLAGADAGFAKGADIGECRARVCITAVWPGGPWQDCRPVLPYLNYMPVLFSSSATRLAHLSQNCACPRDASLKRSRGAMREHEARWNLADSQQSSASATAADSIAADVVVVVV